MSGDAANSSAVDSDSVFETNPESSWISQKPVLSFGFTLYVVFIRVFVLSMVVMVGVPNDDKQSVPLLAWCMCLQSVGSRWQQGLPSSGDNCRSSSQSVTNRLDIVRWQSFWLS